MEKINNIYGCGSDEVGVGDYFAPIVCVATQINPSDYLLIKNLKITDSKKISDSKILEIGEKLTKILKYSVIILDNKKYNEVYQNLKNINKIKAMLHNQAYLNLAKKTTINYPCVVDQFCPIDKYYQHLNSVTEIQEVHMEIKAEDKYLYVAAASIIARYFFLLKLNELNQILKIEIIKGASDKVDQQVAYLYQKYGESIIDNYCKKHFANTKKVLNLLK